MWVGEGGGVRWVRGKREGRENRNREGKGEGREKKEGEMCE